MSEPTTPQEWRVHNLRIVKALKDKTKALRAHCEAAKAAKLKTMEVATVTFLKQMAVPIDDLAGFLVANIESGIPGIDDGP